MEYDEATLMSLKQARRGDLFKESPAGDIANDPAKGAAIVVPGTAGSSSIAEPAVLIL